MAHLIFGKDEILCEWAARQIPQMESGEDFGPARAIGVATGPEKSDRLLAVVVYHMLVPSYGTCMVSMAASSPRWATKGTIRALLSVPFNQYGVQKVWAAMAHTNERAIRFNVGIGFTREAVLRNHFGEGTHAVVTRMLKADFHRIYGLTPAGAPKFAPPRKAA